MLIELPVRLNPALPDVTRLYVNPDHITMVTPCNEDRCCRVFLTDDESGYKCALTGAEVAALANGPGFDAEISPDVESLELLAELTLT